MIIIVLRMSWVSSCWQMDQTLSCFEGFLSISCWWSWALVHLLLGLGFSIWIVWPSGGGDLRLGPAGVWVAPPSAKGGTCTPGCPAPPPPASSTPAAACRPSTPSLCSRSLSGSFLAYSSSRVFNPPSAFIISLRPIEFSFIFDASTRSMNYKSYDVVFLWLF